jgi:lactobin A/cerein 7B family class IIb bacteriocin
MNTLNLNIQELSQEDLRNTNGGWLAFIPVIAGLYVATQLIGACYSAGEKIGEAIYHATH